MEHEDWCQATGQRDRAIAGVAGDPACVCPGSTANTVGHLPPDHPDHTDEGLSPEVIAEVHQPWTT
jgi:hypothetical protein